MGQTLHALLRQVAWQIPEGLPDPLLQQITCDSRAVQDGTLFLGLPGERVDCLLYTSPSPRDRQKSRMPSSA